MPVLRGERPVLRGERISWEGSVSPFWTEHSPLRTEHSPFWTNIPLCGLAFFQRGERLPFLDRTFPTEDRTFPSVDLPFVRRIDDAGGLVGRSPAQGGDLGGHQGGSPIRPYTQTRPYAKQRTGKLAPCSHLPDHPDLPLHETANRPFQVAVWSDRADLPEQGCSEGSASRSEDSAGCSEESDGSSEGSDGSSEGR